jgi:hypothetical protein
MQGLQRREHGKNDQRCTYLYTNVVRLVRGPCIPHPTLESLWVSFAALKPDLHIDRLDSYLRPFETRSRQLQPSTRDRYGRFFASSKYRLSCASATPLSAAASHIPERTSTLATARVRITFSPSLTCLKSGSPSFRLRREVGRGRAEHHGDGTRQTFRFLAVRDCSPRRTRYA